jgi:hypothetical protein
MHQLLDALAETMRNLLHAGFEQAVGNERLTNLSRDVAQLGHRFPAFAALAKQIDKVTAPSSTIQDVLSLNLAIRQCRAALSEPSQTGGTLTHIPRESVEFLPAAGRVFFCRTDSPTLRVLKVRKVFARPGGIEVEVEATGLPGMPIDVLNFSIGELRSVVRDW